LGQPLPGLVVLQEIFGLSDYVRQRCADLAALGYAVLAPQLFARLDPPAVGIEDREDVDSWLAEGMELTARLPWERAEADAVAARPTLRDRAGQVAVPSLHHFGTADAFIPLEQVTEIRRAVTAEGSREQVRFRLHEGAGHAFDNPHPALHHAEAAAAAWQQ